jgi:hypothetical protein
MRDEDVQTMKKKAEQFLGNATEFLAEAEVITPPAE